MNASLEGRIDIRLTCSPQAQVSVELTSTRPQLAQKLMAGRTPQEVAGLAGMVFSLCGKAQAIAAAAACEAAGGRMPAPERTNLRTQAVWLERAQEHVWRLLLDWPVQAGRAPDAASVQALRKQADDPVRFADTLARILQDTVLGEPASVWLQRDLAGLDAWRAAAATPTAALFAGLEAGPDVGMSDVPLLPTLADLDAAAALTVAHAALADAGYCAAPLWQGAPAETGALARLKTHPMLAGWLARRGRGAGARLLARLLELARLPQSALAGEVVVRAWPVAARTGMAGVETARGLLLHVVRLDQAERVADYRIIAPTEWNFHPAGALMQALGGLPGDTTMAAQARLVAQSLDPCVAFDIELIHA